MTPYFLIYFFVASMAFAGSNRHRLDKEPYIERMGFIWIALSIILVIFIGLRYQVGGDWGNYLRNFNLTSKLLFEDAFLAIFSDPGFQLVNLISLNLGLGIYGVNFISSIIFVSGLVSLCRNLPRPLLALAVAVPYLVLVVSMGYVRQACALGLILLAINYFIRDKSFMMFLFLFFAFFFHKSSIIIFPLIMLSRSNNLFSTFLAMGFFLIGFYFLALQDYVETIIGNYAGKQAIQSQGALIRLTMNFIPSVYFLYFIKNFIMPPKEKKLWILFSLISIMLFIGFFFISSSTLLDRIALYLIPIQLVAFSYFPNIFHQKSLQSFAVLIILTYYLAVLTFWLNFAAHSKYWIPYNSILI